MKFASLIFIIVFNIVAEAKEQIFLFSYGSCDNVHLRQSEVYNMHLIVTHINRNHTIKEIQLNLFYSDYQTCNLENAHLRSIYITALLNKLLGPTVKVVPRIKKITDIFFINQIEMAVIREDAS